MNVGINLWMWVEISAGLSSEFYKSVGLKDDLTTNFREKKLSFLAVQNSSIGDLVTH